MTSLEQNVEAHDLMWLILEDNAGRVDNFIRAVSSCQSLIDIRTWRIAEHMIRDLPELLPAAKLISLDHDLYRLEDSDPDPGTGRQVADYLSGLTPLCPVIIHSTNTNAAWGMHNQLTHAGWKAEIIHHLDEPGWIQERWLPMALGMLRG